MTALHLDIETFSECDLKSSGVYKYAEHPSTEVLCCAYRFGDGPVHLWVPDRTLGNDDALRELLAGKAHLHFGREVPADLKRHIESGGEVRAHNAQFERVVLNGVAGKKLSFPPLRIEQMVCTAVKAATCGLPRSLGEACKETGSRAKDDLGRISMLQVTKPKKASKKDPTTRYTPENAPDKFIDLYAYNIDDVLAESDLDSKLPDLPASEQEIYVIDQMMNDRGWLADREAIDNILAVVEEYKRFLEDACAKATADPLSLDGEGLKPTQREKIAEWIRSNGYPQLLDMQAETVKGILANPDVPENVKHVLRIYSTYNAKAITKYDAILDAMCADGRLRGMFIMNGAGTGRWSSIIVQLQNLFRPVIDDPETAVEAFSSRSLEWIRALYPQDPIKVAASCVRSVLIASPGNELMFADYAGIESRVNAWLWGEEWKLKAFRAYDAGTGPDLYKVAYARAFQVTMDSVTKNQRQIGKVQELALGYEGGVGAFVTMVDTYGINLAELTEQVYPLLPPEVLESAVWMWQKFGNRTDLPEKTYIACDGLKQLWRQQHPRIVQGWKDLKEAAELAVQHPGNVYKVADGRLMFKVLEHQGLKWLCMRLPSGRKLWYYGPRWIPPRTLTEVNEHGQPVEREVPGELRYRGIDTRTRQYMEVSTYGGRLCENAVQAISADVLRHAKRRLTDAAYPLVGSVHDEIVTDIAVGKGDDEEVRRLMCADVKWAPGLPLAVEISRGRRYRK